MEAASKVHDLAVYFNDRFNSHVLSARSSSIGTDNVKDINHVLQVGRTKSSCIQIVFRMTALSSSIIQRRSHTG